MQFGFQEGSGCIEASFKIIENVTSEIFWFCNPTQNLRSTIYDRNKTDGMLGYIDSAGPL